MPRALCARGGCRLRLTQPGSSLNSPSTTGVSAALATTRVRSTRQLPTATWINRRASGDMAEAAATGKRTPPNDAAAAAAAVAEVASTSPAVAKESSDAVVTANGDARESPMPWKTGKPPHAPTNVVACSKLSVRCRGRGYLSSAVACATTTAAPRRSSGVVEAEAAITPPPGSSPWGPPPLPVTKPWWCSAEGHHRPKTAAPTTPPANETRKITS